LREADRLREPLLQLASADPPRILLDLAAVKYLGSLTLPIFLAMSKRIHERGGRLVLCNLNPAVRGIFSPWPFHSSLPGWYGIFFAGTLEEGIALCEDRRSDVQPEEGEG
jgi:anti-anti-sigma factor